MMGSGMMNTGGSGWSTGAVIGVVLGALLLGGLAVYAALPAMAPPSFRADDRLSAQSSPFRSCRSLDGCTAGAVAGPRAGSPDASELALRADASASSERRTGSDLPDSGGQRDAAPGYSSLSNSVASPGATRATLFHGGARVVGRNSCWAWCRHVEALDSASPVRRDLGSNLDTADQALERIGSMVRPGRAAFPRRRRRMGVLGRAWCC
jgi:hypothetical protein